MDSSRPPGHDRTHRDRYRRGGGLGQVTARELARAGARVVLAVPDPGKAEPVAAAMKGRIEVRQLDVADVGSVRRFASGWSGSIDVLVNNAGIMNVPWSRTADGFESQMATNYLGPFALTNLLLPHITDRVVTVSSQLHRRGKVHLEDLSGDERSYKAATAYNDSKFAVVLFSTELQRRLSETGSVVRSLVAHPGIASTALAAHSVAGKVTNALRFPFNDVERGALPGLSPPPRTCRATPTSDRTAWPVCAATRWWAGPPRPVLDPGTARQLWKATAQLTGAEGP